MKLISMKSSGLGIFKDIELPIKELGDSRVVALCGSNGVGKTTALELAMIGSIFRETPTRGPLHVIAHDKNAFVESVFKLEQEYTCRVTVDGASKTPKGSAYLINEAGEPLNDGKVSTYKDAIADVFPSKDVMLASTFAAQEGNGRFLKLSPADRKSLFLGMLGQGKLEELSTSAGEHARGIGTDIERVRGGLDSITASTDDVAALAVDRAKKQDMIEFSKKLIRETEAEQKDCAAKLEEWNEKNTNLVLVAEKADTEVGKVQSLMDSKDESVTLGYRKIEVLKEKASAVRLEVDKKVELEKSLADCVDEGDIVELESSLSGFETMKKLAVELRTQWSDANSQLKVERYELENRKHHAKSNVDTARVLLETAQSQAARLGDVPCGGEGKFSGCQLIKSAIDSKNKIEGLVEELKLAEKTERELSTDDLDIPKLEEELKTITEKGKALEFDPNVVDDLERKIKEHHENETRRTRIESEIAAVEIYQSQLDSIQIDIDEGECEIGNVLESNIEVEKNLNDARLLADAATEKRNEHIENKPEQPDRSVLDNANRQLQIFTSDLATIDSSIVSTNESIEKSKQLKIELDGYLAEFDDWKHLQKALGKGGVQALEIDAAGPEVSATANELVHAGFGSRFSLSLETSENRSDNKGTKEVFTLRVIDTERGTDGPAEHLSGGEKVLVEEAIGLAIAIYNARRSGVPMKDLVRDEMTGALSPEKALLYPPMLRCALDLGGFERVYFVSHQKELWELADVCIWFHDETCEIASVAEIIEGITSES